jgi:hypothetical protein
MSQPLFQMTVTATVTPRMTNTLSDQKLDLTKPYMKCFSMAKRANTAETTTMRTKINDAKKINLESRPHSPVESEKMQSIIIESGRDEIV